MKSILLRIVSVAIIIALISTYYEAGPGVTASFVAVWANLMYLHRTIEKLQEK